MRSITKLKEKARLHEQEERWEEAIEAYLQVIRAGDEREGEVELSVFNRIGDLYLRLGRVAEAVNYYETAAARYAEAGLYNNAIALCNKALRYMPEQTHLLRRLGEYCAAQGFMHDARRWYLEYAEQMMLRGSDRDAFSALQEFADLSADPTIREILGRHLKLQGLTEEARTQFVLAYEQRYRAGEEEELEKLKAELLELDPEIDFAQIEAEVAAKIAEEAERQAAVAAYDPLSLGAISLEGPAAGADEERRAAEEEGDDVQASAAVEPAPAAWMAEAAEAEPTAGAGVDAPAAEDRVEPEAAEVEASGEEEYGDDVAESTEPLPYLDLDDGPTVEAAGIETGTEDAPTLEVSLGEGAGLLDVTGEEEMWAGSVSLDSGEEDPLTLIDDGRALAAVGQIIEAVRRLERAHEALAAAERYGDALSAAEELVQLDPDNVSAHQSRVQYAVMVGDEQRQLAAYMDLGACLERAGEAAKAESVYRHVLELWPEYEGARTALRGVAGGSAVPEGGPAAAGDEGDYIDLGGLLREEEGEATTRFVVPDEEPSGDEERDFAEILEQFKTHLRQHVAVDDRASHYDLGIAFKEMGLIDEAIAEFQIALRGGHAPLKVYEELGHCFMLKDQPNVAVKILQRALELESANELELLGIYYHMGRCYEALGKAELARDAYERVISLDLNFGDVAERLARL